MTILAVLARPAQGDEAAAQARQVVAKWKDTVVTARLVIKMTMSGGPAGGGEQEENKNDVNGTVIDPSGLTVVSLSAVDPGEMYRRMAGAAGEKQQFKIETQLTDAKLRFADGTEVPAKVVLRDKDLDLAFLRPTDKLAQPAAALDLSQAGAPQLLDPVVTVNRLGNASNWEIAPRIDRIQAILTKPRTVYVPQGGDEIGTPAFTLEGKVVGVTLVRLPLGAPGARGDEDAGGMAIILPAADVLEVAKQAPAG
jgi:hypothetical protein